MVNRVENKQAYETDVVDLKFSSFVFNPQINKGNGKEHMNQDYYTRDLNLRRAQQHKLRDFYVSSSQPGINIPTNTRSFAENFGKAAPKLKV